MSNHLKSQTSPYLLQHADNPVAWYPWCEEAFLRAKREDKPIFLSIGYSTCHWCHVMAKESFEDEMVAQLLNRYFIAVKVDKEERPDIDSVYMSVCQAFTGSGGWPTTILLTPDQRPFFAGTYFPKVSKNGYMGLIEILQVAWKKWQTDRESLLKAADAVVAALNGSSECSSAKGNSGQLSIQTMGFRKLADSQVEQAIEYFKRTFDAANGGFGRAPKFPSPHNLLFLMRYSGKMNDKEAMDMAEKTLLQMYRGGMFDHIGGGFCRYSTDKYFLVPHFEKMLYDNALLILAYVRAYERTKNGIYRRIAERTADYVLREMTDPAGGFYSAQDADSEGEEGKYYVFRVNEIIQLLGEREGRAFCHCFDITERGNFEGKNIPNLLKNKQEPEDFRDDMDRIYEYRKARMNLHRDDKVLTSWNGLMIAAMANLYCITKKDQYRDAAVQAQKFIDETMYRNGQLAVSWREGAASGRGFLDDYANEIFALLTLYQVTEEKVYLEQAKRICERVQENFYDKENGGYFMYGDAGEQLIFRPKETYDGAVFSGNSAMAYNLVQLFVMTGAENYRKLAEQQLWFMSGECGRHPAGSTMYLAALLDYLEATEEIDESFVDTGK
ncbi:MAG: thioredoxin domain-containing protein [Lachnospiraceae bacterium]|nr:thioredoxin domain-containing protein [Lachnospiraceae bacterium]